MDLESVVRCLALRVGSTLRVWIFVLSVGLLVAGCGGGQSTASTGQVGAMSPEEEAFEACMEEAGYSIDDLDRGEPLTPEELEELGLEIGEGEEIYRASPTGTYNSRWARASTSQESANRQLAIRRLLHGAPRAHWH